MLLEIKNLSVTFTGAGGHAFKAVKDVSLNIERGQTLGIVGESGCGKSVTAFAVMGVLPDKAVIGGDVIFEGGSLLRAAAAERRRVLGGGISMIFQEPMTALNPLKRVGRQIAEAVELHTDISRRGVKRLVLETMRRVGLTDAEVLYNRYPHELSGGMRQRVMIAGSIILKPKLIIADEPTTALDVTVQAQILRLLKSLVKENDMSLIFISHDFAVIHQLCDRVAVMCEGRIAETGETARVLKSPSHEYTRRLISSVLT